MTHRYDDILAVLKDHTHFSSDRTRSTNPIVKQLEEYRLSSGPIGRAPTMLGIDPPAHTRMRNLVNKAFTPRVVERVRPHIQEIADEDWGFAGQLTDDWRKAQRE